MPRVQTFFHNGSLKPVIPDEEKYPPVRARAAGLPAGQQTTLGRGNGDPSLRSGRQAGVRFPGHTLLNVGNTLHSVIPIGGIPLTRGLYRRLLMISCPAWRYLWEFPALLFYILILFWMINQTYRNAE